MNEDEQKERLTNYIPDQLTREEILKNLKCTFDPEFQAKPQEKLSTTQESNKQDQKDECEEKPMMELESEIEQKRESEGISIHSIMEWIFGRSEFFYYLFLLYFILIYSFIYLLYFC